MSHFSPPDSKGQGVVRHGEEHSMTEKKADEYVCPADPAEAEQCESCQ
jgi:hypothetical protein